jgi:hypothetical protein
MTILGESLGQCLLHLFLPLHAIVCAFPLGLLQRILHDGILHSIQALLGGPCRLQEW